MAEYSIVGEIKKGRVLVSDGAWGTILIQNGLKAGECPELWCLKRFDDVVSVAKSYMVRATSSNISIYRSAYRK